MDIAEQRHPHFCLKGREGQVFFKLAHLTNLDGGALWFDHEKIRMAVDLKLAARGALTAGFEADWAMAVEGGGKGPGQGFFANPHGAFEEKGVGQPALLDGAVQQFFGLILADDPGKRKGCDFLGLFHVRYHKRAR